MARQTLCSMVRAAWAEQPAHRMIQMMSPAEGLGRGGSGQGLCPGIEGEAVGIVGQQPVAEVAVEGWRNAGGRERHVGVPAGGLAPAAPGCAEGSWGGEVRGGFLCGEGVRPGGPDGVSGGDDPGGFGRIEDAEGAYNSGRGGRGEAGVADGVGRGAVNGDGCDGVPMAQDFGIVEADGVGATMMVAMPVSVSADGIRSGAGKDTGGEGVEGGLVGQRR